MIDIEQALAEAWNVHEAIAWHVDPYHLCSRHRCLLDILATEPMQAIARALEAAVEYDRHMEETGMVEADVAKRFHAALAGLPRAAIATALGATDD